MIPRVLTRMIRPMGLATVGTAAWANRVDLRRWLRFARRAVDERHTRAFSEMFTEAKVRVAVSADPLLRRDPSLEDLAVRDGVVTLITNTSTWPEASDRTLRLMKLKGISHVTARAAPSTGANAGPFVA